VCIRNPPPIFEAGYREKFVQEWGIRSMIVERVNAGLAAARAKGTRLGRPSRRNPHFDAVAKLRGEGLSGRKIAKQLGIGAPLAFKIIGQLKAAA
jgi:DNA invertase Pin-like site-specific DNA recombinase